MIFYDSISKEFAEHHRGEILKFVTPIPLAYHKLCSSSIVPNLKFPKMASQVIFS